VGASTPLFFMVHPKLGFWLSAPVLAVFTFAMFRCKKRIDALMLGLEDLQKKHRELFAVGELDDAAGAEKKHRSSLKAGPAKPRKGRMKRSSTLSGLSAAKLSVNTARSRNTDSSQGQLPGSNTLDCFASEDEDRELGYFTNIVMTFLVVHGLSFMDAFISRLPFAFLTLAIVDQTGEVWIASVVLLSYQSGRAIGQWIQTFGAYGITNFLLTSVSVVCYAGLVTARLIDPKFEHWFYFMIPTGLSETLPVQQHYLSRLMQVDTDSQIGQTIMRRYVKKSHTGTGVGSAAAFITSAYAMGVFKVLGVGFLGLGVAVLKLLLVVVIECMLPRQVKRGSVTGMSAVMPMNNQERRGSDGFFSGENDVRVGRGSEAAFASRSFIPGGGGDVIVGASTLHSPEPLSPLGVASGSGSQQSSPWAAGGAGQNNNERDNLVVSNLP